MQPDLASLPGYKNSTYRGDCHILRRTWEGFVSDDSISYYRGPRTFPSMSENPALFRTIVFAGVAKKYRDR